MPSDSTSADPYTSLTLGGAGKLVLDSAASNQFTRDIFLGDTEGEIEITSGKTLTLNRTGKVDTSILAAGKNLTLSGAGTFAIVPSGTTFVGGKLTFNLESVTSSSHTAIALNAENSELTINTDCINTRNITLIIAQASGKININANTTIFRLNNHTGGTTTIKAGTILSVYQDTYLHGNSGKIIVNGTFNACTDGIPATAYGYLGAGAILLGTKDYHLNEFIVESGGKANIAVDATTANTAGFNNSGIITLRGDMELANSLRMFNGSTLNLEGGQLSAKSIILANYYSSGERTTAYVYKTGETVATFNIKKSATLDTVVFNDTSITIGGTDTGRSDYI